MERKKLAAEDVESRITELKGWTAEDDKLRKRFTFANFAESLEFVNRVGAIAESADHHPDITFGWGYAEIETTTHDRGGITDFDFDLARKIGEL